MASITPTNLFDENAGSLNLHIAEFASSADNGDIWESGIPGIVTVLATLKDSPGNESGAGASATWTASNGTIRMIGENNSAFVLLVYSKS